MYRQRLKLLHACIFFSENCADVGRMKLYKLLFLLDFEFYRIAGRSVTGLRYEAWKQGPVPAEFDQEWKNGLKGELGAGLVSETIQRRYDYDNDEELGLTTYKLVPRIKFEQELFSPRELQIMQKLAATYFNKSATDMSVESHAAFGYWDEVWRYRNHRNGTIPYDLVFDRQNTEQDQIMREYAEEKQKFSETSD